MQVDGDWNTFRLVAERTTQTRARVVIGVDEVSLRDKLLESLKAWPELEILDVHSSLDALMQHARRESADLAIVDALLCRHGIARDVEALAVLGLPVVVFTGRGSYPSVVELPGAIAVRAIQLPKWVLDREDELTSAHTRALLLDLAGHSRRGITGEFDSPADLSPADEQARRDGA